MALESQAFESPQESARTSRLLNLEAKVAQMEYNITKLLLSVENATDLQMIYEVSKAIIVGIREKRPDKEILDQIKLVVDRESQEAIREGRMEYEEGKMKSYASAEDLAEALDKSA